MIKSSNLNKSFSMLLVYIILLHLTIITSSFTSHHRTHHRSTNKNNVNHVITISHNNSLNSRCKKPTHSFQLFSSNNAFNVSISSSSPDTTNKHSEIIDEKKRLQQLSSIPKVQSFKVEPFNPPSFFLFTNKHIQTLSGVFLRDYTSCQYLNANDSTIEQLSSVFRQVLKLIFSSENEQNNNLQVILKSFTKEEEENDGYEIHSKRKSQHPKERKPNTIVDSKPLNKFWDKRERIYVEDDDFYVVDYKYASTPNDHDGGSEPAKGTVILIHGLESNSSSNLSIDMAKSYHNLNMHVICINFRGCGGDELESPFGKYHAGFTQDLHHFLNIYTTRLSQSTLYSDVMTSNLHHPIYLSGFSLGANVVLKCLGELSMDAVEKYNIKGAAVTGAPFDLTLQYHILKNGWFERTIYSNALLKSMKRKVDSYLDRYCNGDENTPMFNYQACKNALTIDEIEENFLCPIFGFKDKFDYYRQSASLPLLKDIVVPTLIVNAVDDPFFDPDFFPWDLDCDRGASGLPIKLERTVHGGHLGYMFHQTDNCDSVDECQSSVSWMPRQLSRFIQHVHNESEVKNTLTSKAKSFERLI